MKARRKSPKKISFLFQNGFKIDQQVCTHSYAYFFFCAIAKTSPIYTIFDMSHTRGISSIMKCIKTKIKYSVINNNSNKAHSVKQSNQ